MSKIDFMSLKTIDFCDDVRDGTHDSPKHLDSGKLLITSKNIKGDSIDFENASYISEEDYNKINERSLVEINDVLYSMIGTVGLVYRVDQQPNYAIKNMGLFKIHDELKSKWLYYYLNSPKAKGKVLSMLSGSTQKFISLSNLRNLEIEFPQNIEDAKRIIKICESIDKKIKLNNEINNNLYEETVVLYKAKFAGVEQGNKTVGEYIIPKRGKNLLTRDAIEGSIPVVAGGIEPSAYHNQFNTHFPVITISASGANAGYTNLWSTPIWASDCSYIDDSVTKNVYFWYVALKTRQQEIFDAQTGSAQAHIYPRHIAGMPIAELNIDEVRNYNMLVEPLFKKIGENKKENEQLSQLRNTLLPKLMNGEIDLDSIEI